jgi:hypothetical protein
MPEVLDFKELVLQCTKKFNSEKRIIQLEGRTPVFLAPTIFEK